MTKLQEIRDTFAWMAESGIYAEDGTIEIVGASFLAEDPSIFGEVNHDYVARELAWYESQSLAVDDIPGKTPAIWKKVADRQGKINSNYGYLFYSEGNHNQFDSVIVELLQNPSSRRALAIYQRPTMHTDATDRGMSDFVCTNAVQYIVRDNQLYTVVQMRSNDAVFGYRNDYAWQRHAQRAVRDELALCDPDKFGNLGVGDMVWQVGSLHVYPRHFHLLEQYRETGDWDVPVTPRKD